MLSTGALQKSRLVMASSGELNSHTPPETTFDELRGRIAAYVSKKIGTLDAQFLSADSFESHDGYLASASLSMPNARLWVARLSEPDDGTPGRSWVVELGAGLMEQTVLFGCRLNVFSRNYDFEFERSVPRALREFVEKFEVKEYGAQITASVTRVETEQDVSGLVDLIQNKNRWRNIVVVSSDNGVSLIDARYLARSLAGVAHLYEVTPDASFILSDCLGRDLSVFDRGVRIYKAGFSLDDDKTQHPLILKRQLLNAGASQYYRSEIQNICFQSSIERADLSKKIPSFLDVKFAASSLALKSLSGESREDKSERYEAERNAREAAEKQAEQAMSLAIQEEELRKEADSQRDRYRAQLFAAQSRIEALEDKLAAVGGSAETGSRPTTFLEIPQWVEANFPSKLVLHPRVHRALKSASFHDIEIVCETLSLLANEYRKVMRGELRREDFDKLLATRHIDMSGSISESRAKEYGDEYFVFWNGKKEFLSGHIEKGNSRDEKFCLRIYFFWSPAEEIIVVGWMPSHLKNRLS